MEGVRGEVRGPVGWEGTAGPSEGRGGAGRPRYMKDGEARPRS